MYKKGTVGIWNLTPRPLIYASEILLKLCKPDTQVALEHLFIFYPAEESNFTQSDLKQVGCEWLRVVLHIVGNTLDNTIWP